MNVKGTAAGGGNALLIPMTEFSLGLTGDINDIMNAHNLAMVALNARMQHERNYTDEELAKRGLKRIDVDPERVEFGWVMDFCAQCLRNIRIGMGTTKNDGFEMNSKFVSLSVLSSWRSWPLRVTLRISATVSARSSLLMTRREIPSPPRISRLTAR
jgi:formyltetrahydrofolate synthetase